MPTAICPAFLKKRLASFPNAMENNPIIRYFIPTWLKKKLINKILLGDSAKNSAIIYNKVRCQYGLPPIYNFTSLVKGDLTLLPDLPELSGLSAEELPEGYIYTGPLFASLPIEIPKEVIQLFKKRKGLNIYVAMGSSGTPKLLKRIIEYLRSIEEHNIVCATTSILDPEELGPPTETFFAARFLPAHLVNELADIAVIHGGHGTVQTAVWAGTPVVGIGMQWEQQSNLDGLVKAGMGIRIPLHSVSKQKLLNAVKTVQNPTFITKAKQMQKIVRQWDGAKEAVRRMNDYVAKIYYSEEDSLGF